MKKFTKIATVAVMTMVTAGVFAGCGLKGGCLLYTSGAQSR